MDQCKCGWQIPKKFSLRYEFKSPQGSRGGNLTVFIIVACPRCGRAHEASVPIDLGEPTEAESILDIPENLRRGLPSDFKM